MLEHLGKTAAQRLSMLGLIFAIVGGGLRLFVPKPDEIKVFDIEIKGDSAWLVLVIIGAALLVVAVISWLTNRNTSSFVFAVDDEVPIVRQKVRRPYSTDLAVDEPKKDKSLEALMEHIEKTNDIYHIEVLLTFVRAGRKIQLNTRRQINHVLAANQLEGLGLIKKNATFNTTAVSFNISNEQYTFLYSKRLELQQRLKELKASKVYEYSIVSLAGISIENFDEVVKRYIKENIDYHTNSGSLVIRYSSDKELEKARRIYSDILNGQ